MNPLDDWVRAFTLRAGAYELLADAQGDDLLSVDQPFPVGFRPADLLARFRGGA